MQSRLLFTGKVFDPDADMYYFNARWYSPQTGRFASEDPDRDWLNCYDYAVKNPPQYTDPSGLKKKGGFWNGVKNFFKRMGNSFRNNSENDDSSSSDSSSFESGSSSSSDSGDDSKDSKSKEPNDGIDTVRDNSRSNSPNHGSNDSRKAFYESENTIYFLKKERRLIHILSHFDNFRQEDIKCR